MRSENRCLFEGGHFGFTDFVIGGGAMGCFLGDGENGTRKKGQLYTYMMFVIFSFLLQDFCKFFELLIFFIF